MAAGMGLEAVRSNVTTSVQRMSGAQRVTLGLAFAATAIGLFLVTRVTGRTPMSTLYADLEPEVAAEIVDQLEAQEVHYELASGGRVILVPSDQVHALRLELSAQGLPASGEGWSVLDDQGITTSEFDQRVGYQRAMEGELAKTIAAIEGVSDANVHLVMPEDDLFVDDDVQASASVLLVTGGPGSISPMQVEAIVNLVASSVEGMTPDRVSVTDQNGQILAAPGEGRGVVGLQGDSQLRAKQELEADLEADLESLLSAVVGPGLAMVTVAADLDFDAVTTVTEQFEAPVGADGTQIVAAETTRDEDYVSTANVLETGILGTEVATAEDLITSDGTTDGQESAYTLDERDATFAMNKVVTNADNAVGEVASLSVAVLLDETAVDAARLPEIEQLVQAAAGIDAERGDTLAVTLLPIDEEVRAAIEAATAATETAESGGLDLIGLIRTIGTIVIALVVIFFGLRVVRGGKKRQVLDSVALEELESGPLALEAGDETRALGELPEAKLHNLIANQPDDVAGVLRSWLNEEEVTVR
jgi:flagellar M-ring protein FliF